MDALLPSQAAKQAHQRQQVPGEKASRWPRKLDSDRQMEAWVKRAIRLMAHEEIDADLALSIITGIEKLRKFKRSMHADASDDDGDQALLDLAASRMSEDDDD